MATAMTIDLRLDTKIAPSRVVRLGGAWVARCRHTAISQDGDSMIDTPTVMVLVSGRMEIRWDDCRLSISAGQAMFATPRRYCVSHDAGFEAVNIGLTAECVASFWDRHADALAPARGAATIEPAFLLRLTPFLKNSLESLPLFLDTERPHHHPLVKLKLDELVLALIDADARVCSRLKTSGQYDRRLVEYVATRPVSHHSLHELARGAGQSVSTFKRHFRAATGVPPAAWLRQKRLARAKLLLESSDRSVTDIAFDVGFSSVSHFVYTFRRRYQITPHRIRTTRRERNAHDE
jgi:AraC family transcriptional regulator, exoenzyme S synthesis regulatory protein ExsA